MGKGSYHNKYSKTKENKMRKPAMPDITARLSNQTGKILENCQGNVKGWLKVDSIYPNCLEIIMA